MALRRAPSAALSMASVQVADKVPMLITRAPMKLPNSSSSSTACTMAGEAPIASSALAAMSIETKLVMFWTSGRLALKASRARPASVATPIR